MNTLLPYTTTATELQRNFKAVNQKAKKLGLSPDETYLFLKFSSSAEDCEQTLRKLLEYHRTKAGQFTTIAGNATQSIPVHGINSTHACMVMIHTEGASPVTILKAECGDGEITVTFSADPGSDHVVNWMSNHS